MLVIVLILLLVICHILVLKLFSFLELFNVYIHYFLVLQKDEIFWLDNVLGLTVKSLSNTHWESQIKRIKVIRFQGPQIRLALLELHKSCDDAKSKSEAKSLVNALENFEILLGMIILYDIFFPLIWCVRNYNLSLCVLTLP